MLIIQLLVYPVLVLENTFNSCNEPEIINIDQEIGSSSVIIQRLPTPTISIESVIIEPSDPEIEDNKEWYEEEGDKGTNLYGNIYDNAYDEGY
jgi:hypothetical protein